MSDLIAQRKQELEKLRQQNEASFQRVLEKLRIAYHTPPLQEDVPLQTRKGWVEHQVLDSYRIFIFDLHKHI